MWILANSNYLSVIGIVYSLVQILVMVDNNSKKWSIELEFVQFQKNCSHHRVIGRFPYKALFESDPKIGLTTSKLPSQILQKISSEEDLLMYSKDSDDQHSSIKMMASHCSVCGNEITVKINSASAILDNGKEFYNSTFDALMEKHNIHKYSIYSTMKACIVERFNRTLKEKMFREFTARGSHEWVSILPSLINEYNNSKHRTIGMTPVQADPTTVEIKQRKIVNGTIQFNVGDNVRISTYKGVFAKGYSPSWSTEIFKIVKINETLPTTYQLQDYSAKPIAGCFYSEEILKTNYPNDYLVEKIIPTLENNFSRAIDMNVFRTSQASETKKNISNLEQSIKSFSAKLDKIEHLLEENQDSIKSQEQQNRHLQLKVEDKQEQLEKIETSLQYITDKLKNPIAQLMSSNNVFSHLGHAMRSWRKQ
ncbi:hypothetical protein QTP88_000935 [Uroleucon formosanum]